MSLIFEDSSAVPGTHVLIIGVGEYAYGRDRAESDVGGALPQLTSPPKSARAIADWFIGSFQNRERPLASVALLLSEADPHPYHPSRPSGAAPVTPANATLTEVKAAARAWADRLHSHKENMAVFYFCGHGASLGQQAALLLNDFGETGRDFEGAIDVDILCGTMRNARAVRQAYLLDCCRTRADDLYQNEPRIGSRILSESGSSKDHDENAQQFVLFPTIDGEEAFGVKGGMSAFTHSVIDALSFAAADPRSGTWRTSTGKLFSEVDQLITYRMPAQLRQRSKPTVVDSSNFYFNDIGAPSATRSFVTISDPSFWSDEIEIDCVDPAGVMPPYSQRGSADPDATCCSFDLKEGTWRFSGKLSAPHVIEEREQIVFPPVAYVTLEVQ